MKDTRRCFMCMSTKAGSLDGMLVHAWWCNGTELYTYYVCHMGNALRLQMNGLHLVVPAVRAIFIRIILMVQWLMKLLKCGNVWIIQRMMKMSLTQLFLWLERVTYTQMNCASYVMYDALNMMASMTNGYDSMFQFWRSFSWTLMLEHTTPAGSGMPWCVVN